MVITEFVQDLLLQSLPRSIRGENNKGSWNHYGMPRMRLKRHGCAAATLNNDTIVVMGGYNDSLCEIQSVDIYKDGVWTAGVPLKTKRLGSVAATTIEHNSECIFVVGGHNGQTVLNSVERYQLCLDMWTTGSELFLPNFGLFNAAAVAIQERLYVIGGHDGKNAKKEMLVFNPDISTTRCWVPGPPMEQERFQFGATVLGKYIYVVGGGDSSNGALQSMERYDSERQVWTTLPPMSCKRKGCVAAGVGEYIYVFGGYDGNHQVLNSCERYDPISGNWSPLPSMAYKRFGSAVAVLGNRILIIGGFDGKAAMDTVEQFTVPSNSTSSSQALVATEEDNADSPTLIATTQLLQITTNDDDDEPPDELQCPITGDLMIDPVVASDGHSYEREAIEEWIRRFPITAIPRSPSTNGPIQRNVFPNHNLKSLCRQYSSK